MNNLPESTVNLILSGIMGLMGGLLTIPINSYFAYLLKRDEISYKNRLDDISKKRELLLQHKLELQLIEKKRELDNSLNIQVKGG